MKDAAFHGFVADLIRASGERRGLRFPRFVGHVRVENTLKAKGYRLVQASVGEWFAEKMPTEAPAVPPEAKYLVVGLTDEGEEVKRVTVFASRLDEAKNLFSDFCDWIDVFECAPDGTPAARRRDLGWSRS